MDQPTCYYSGLHIRRRGCLTKPLASWFRQRMASEGAAKSLARSPWFTSLDQILASPARFLTSLASLCVASFSSMQKLQRYAFLSIFAVFFFPSRTILSNRNTVLFSSLLNLSSFSLISVYILLFSPIVD